MNTPRRSARLAAKAAAKTAQQTTDHYTATLAHGLTLFSTAPSLEARLLALDLLVLSILSIPAAFYAAYPRLARTIRTKFMELQSDQRTGPDRQAVFDRVIDWMDQVL